ncbi:hypothetical protein NXG27_07520 [Megasphaera paucivorans]|uniref:transposase family protein n=1 Tax=Megasphaera paucivorans TaxID=349095 RepID=UPI00115FAD91|nr:transposase family protein [Megasphaera paucivorans]
MSRMSGKLSRTVLRREKGSNPFSLVDFTSPRYAKIFIDAGCKISMDHRGRAYDNIFIERLWRTVKYENVFIRENMNRQEKPVSASMNI